MEQKVGVLDLNIGIKSQKKFINLGCLDAKGRRAKKKKM
jgi:hypothetical protein